MAYKTILFLLLSTLFKSLSFAQGDSLFHRTKYHSDIDSILTKAISQNAFPGCVLYASHRGQPFLLEAYGYHTYDSLRAVSIEDLYDLASITKVMASTLALMKMYEDQLVDLDAPLKTYVDHLGWGKIGKVTLRECLAHQAGLKSWIKFYKEIERHSGNYRNRTIRDTKSPDYPYLIAEGKFLHKDFYRKIKRMIRRSPVARNPEYVYSGLFFYMVPEMVMKLAGMPMDVYLDRYFYDPMNLDALTFNPLDRFPKSRIVPTEIDTFFRFEPIHGQVHDEGAILMKGVSGNAGLFGNVENVARLWHMLMNGGVDGDRQYLHPATIDLFTSYQYPANNNRRALGFDKPLLEYDSLKSSVARSASITSYGHTGYTGTLVWADPTHEFLYIFLSNRVYPSRNNLAIYQLNVRPGIHQKLYDFLLNQEPDPLDSNN